MDATHALFENLIDYAGLFPPAELEVEPAVEEYDTLRQGARAWMLGRFILPASRVFEVCEQIGQGDPFPLSVIVDGGSDPVAWLTTATARLATVVQASTGNPIRVEALEVPVPPPAAARDTYDSVIAQFGMVAHNAGLRGLPIFVELTRDAQWERLLPGAMAALARAKFGAKLRCGGVVQTAFPTSEQIAAFVRAAYEHEVPFKATAGLHHPVRRRDPGTGLLMHGFLNLLAATLFIRDGAGDQEVIEILEERDEAAFRLAPDTFSWRERSASLHEIQVGRKSGLISYGSCSVEEPVGDLIALNMLQPSQAPL
ncbi:MAG: hypothetical protein M3N19_07905 [Candidatus Eremiobacteraeota bacterium]|nr:hypothetical protein [Candidatus Eremiobacteraeota bacterium]